MFMKRHFRTMLRHITRHVSMLIHHLQGYIFTLPSQDGMKVSLHKYNTFVGICFIYILKNAR
jgi:hypothetical protein